MAKFTTLPNVVVLLFVVCLGVAPAQALNTRSFVSALGSDTNACTRAAPCRTFQAAHDKTAAEGEIDVLDPAGYGAMNITKAITVHGHGFAGITVATNSDGITIGASSTDFINLSGLIIEGAGVGKNGITFTTGKSLNIQDCVIRRLQNGINFTPTASSKLFVSDTAASDNSAFGILVFPSGSAVAVTGALSRVAVNNNDDGIAVNAVESTGTIKLTVADSMVAGNIQIGIISQTSAGHAAPEVMVRNTSVVNNSTGVEAFGGATAILRFTRSTLTGNDFAWVAQTSGLVLSYGDNNIDGNNNNNFAPPGPLAEQ